MSLVQKFMRNNQRGFLKLIVGGRFAFSVNVLNFQHVIRYGRRWGYPYWRELSTMRSDRGKLTQKGTSRSILLAKLGIALKEHKIDEVWKMYKDFKGRYGFPDQNFMVNLITELSYSSDPKWLHWACSLVLSIYKDKSVLLKPDTLTKLALSLSRAQIPVSASAILRIMLEKCCLPSLDVMRMVFLHLVKTETGTYLASNMLEEISYSFLKLNANKSAQTKPKKPDVSMLNLVLDACVKFGAPLKGQQIIELMAQIGVVADAHSAVIIARLHEMNGLRDELKKFKTHADILPVTFLHHYQHIYDRLLSLHFKFNDIDSASSLLLDLCRYHESNHFQMEKKEQQKSCTISMGSYNVQTGLKLQFLPQLLPRDFVCKVDKKPDFVLYKNGKFVLTNKGLAKLIIGYKRAGRINEFSELLINIQNMLSLLSDSPCSDVIDACIHVGWLETAHDILDDLESAKYCVREGSYTFLLTAYYKKHMFRQVEGLLRQMKQVGLAINHLDNGAFDSHVSETEDTRKLDLKELTLISKTDLANSIIQIMTEEDQAASFLLHEYNSSIYFFTKAKMIEDAKHTYWKMQKMNIHPTSTTFFHLICGYCSFGMYREITILWADVKRNKESQRMVCHRDLYELLLLAFIRGGYFERVMEVIGFMMENNMFLDKWNYRNEFLKFHRDLYRTLTATDAKDDTQRRRIEHVKAFRKWAGIG